VGRTKKPENILYCALCTGSCISIASFENEKIKIKKYIHIGVATGTEDGLVAPVIKDVNKKTLEQIQEKIEAFKEKSQKMRFDISDLSDATFTISNLGMYAVDSFNAIINPPQAGILAIGKIRKGFSIRGENQIIIQPKVTLSLTVDHRFIDGYHAANFLSDLINKIENEPATML
jgi:pyruvate dehydrogenase E2 component (dihydrolipoamide acetyltransferase)